MKAKSVFGIALLALCGLFITSCDDDDNGIDNITDYEASLSAADSVVTNATGSFVASYDDDSNELTYTLTWNGMDATAAHLHNEDNPNEIVPLNVTASSNSPVEGTITLTAEQEDLLENEKFYVNVHSAEYPDGEISGEVNED